MSHAKQNDVTTSNHKEQEALKKREKARKKAIRREKRFTVFTAILVFFIIIEVAIGGVGLHVINEMVENSTTLDVTDFVGEESTKIYDDSGNLITEVGVYLRENVTYDKLPESLIDAFLSIEDSRYFTHFGFDIPRFTKAAIENLRNGDLGQGGSTFTMQLVKNTYFTVDSMNANDAGTERVRSIEYKVQQIYLSIKLERIISKKEIFQLYLNKLNFGGNVRGVQRAAQYYFGKNVYELNLSESAMLAGIVNLPNRYNPYAYLDYGTTRRNEVLYQMLNHGYITEDQYDLARAVKVEDTLAGERRQITEDSQYQSYLDVVLDEAQQMTGYDPTIRGMRIYTHLNQELQKQVEAIQNDEDDYVQFPDELMQVAMLCMDNQTGAIVAIGGGRNYDGARLLNRATMNYKQPGSSVKPLLSYALAFEYLGYSLDEILLDKPITYPGESMVLVNASGNYNGDVTLKDAVGNSLNIPAILTLQDVVEKVGKQTVVNYMQSIGFSRITQDNFHLSFAIGGTWFETTCKELAGAHSMLINSGVYNEPHTIEKIILTSNNTEYYPENQNIKVLSSGSSWLTAQLMENNVTGPYYNYMQILAREYPVYAKTGTTDWGRDGVQYGIPVGQMKDKWMVASTSNYTNVVWVGYDMAVAGQETYYTRYKSNLNIPGRINKLLLDKEEELFGIPEEYAMPDDVEDQTYVNGTWPHVKIEDWMDPSVAITSKVSKTGAENTEMISSEEYLELLAEENGGETGITGTFDQYGNVSITWANSSGICIGDQRNISLHDNYNDIEQWGACLVDLSWLTGGGSYWATIYADDYPVGEIYSETGTGAVYVDGLYGTVKICGGSYDDEGNQTGTACTVATYQESAYDPNLGFWNNGEWTTYDSGYYDENGNWVSNAYSQYGYWDENGAWIGQGYWDENGFHEPQ